MYRKKVSLISGTLLKYFLQFTAKSITVLHYYFQKKLFYSLQFYYIFLSILLHRHSQRGKVIFLKIKSLSTKSIYSKIEVGYKFP